MDFVYYNFRSERTKLQQATIADFRVLLIGGERFTGSSQQQQQQPDWNNKQWLVVCMAVYMYVVPAAAYINSNFILGVFSK